MYSLYDNSFRQKHLEIPKGLSILRRCVDTTIHETTQQTALPGIKEKVLFLYAMGMDSFRICEQMYKLYGIELSYQETSRITDCIGTELEKWQSRPLRPVYPFLFMDYFPYKVKEGAEIVTRNACTLLGVTAKGYKEILSIRPGIGEEGLLCRDIFKDLKQRGVQDILIFCAADPARTFDAIHDTYPDTGIYQCMIRLLLYSSKYVSSCDRSRFLSDCRKLCQAASKEEGRRTFLKLKANWNDRYPFAIQQWENCLPQLDSCFHLPDAIRSVMCTTGILKGLQDQYQRTSRTQFIYENDLSLTKTLYVAGENISRKWTQHLRGWDQVFRQLLEQYGERLTPYL